VPSFAFSPPELNRSLLADTSVVEPALLSTIGLATLAEVAAVTKRLIKQ